MKVLRPSWDSQVAPILEEIRRVIAIIVKKGELCAIVSTETSAFKKQRGGLHAPAQRVNYKVVGEKGKGSRSMLWVDASLHHKISNNRIKSPLTVRIF